MNVGMGSQSAQKREGNEGRKVKERRTKEKERKKRREKLDCLVSITGTRNHRQCNVSTLEPGSLLGHPLSF